MLACAERPVRLLYVQMVGRRDYDEIDIAVLEEFAVAFVHTCLGQHAVHVITLSGNDSAHIDACSGKQRGMEVLARQSKAQDSCSRHSVEPCGRKLRAPS